LAENILELRGLSKSFGTNQVLFDVNFSLKPGEVHAIIGENGAGKSTMMNITYGLVKPNSGEIYIDGKKVDINDPNDAEKNGICFVHQEIALCQEMTIAQNILMTRVKNMKDISLNYKKINEEAQKLIDDIVPGFDVSQPVESLNIAGQQVVEIAKALSMDCKILILDEPTSSLSDKETVALYRIMDNLKEKGIGIVYISHRLAEIFEKCDRVSVLRDGYMINTYNVKEVSAAQLVNDMAGREMSNIYPPKAENIDYSDETVMLEVKNLSSKRRFKDVNFKLHKGEILGFGGLVGAGRTEVMQAIFGADRVTAGEVVLNGKTAKISNPGDALDHGIGLIPEDRKNQGVLLGLSVKENVSFSSLKQAMIGPFVNKKKDNAIAEEYIKKLRIKTPSVHQLVKNLSGGNQQKVVLAKALATQCDVIIFDEPTRGIDVGAKREIYHIIDKIASEGVAVIMISSDMPELIGMSDRIYVMKDGAVVAEIKEKNDMQQEKILSYTIGQK
jgi:ABC-type sugar transport system ATPase subunit